MGWQPLTFCPICGDAHDVYMAPGERVCDCCKEIAAIDRQDKIETAILNAINYWQPFYSKKWLASWPHQRRPLPDKFYDQILIEFKKLTTK